MLSSVRQALGGTTSYVYDVAGDLTARIDPTAARRRSPTTPSKRRVHRTCPTALSERARTTPTAADWAGNTTQFAYDGLGHLLKAIDVL